MSGIDETMKHQSHRSDVSDIRIHVHEWFLQRVGHLEDLHVMLAVLTDLRNGDRMFRGSGRHRKSNACEALMSCGLARSKARIACWTTGLSDSCGGEFFVDDVHESSWASGDIETKLS
jgi:hypothetical protein